MSQAEAEAVAHLVRVGQEPKTVEVKRGTQQSVELLIVRGIHGTEVVDPKKFTDQYLEAPERRKGVARHQTLQSFIDHVNRFKDDDSALFATDAALTCVFDYHREGPEADPRFGEHRSVYSFPVSRQWQTWTNADKQTMSVQDFAEFLEDNVEDVGDPERATEAAKEIAKLLGATFATPAGLIGLSKGLNVHVDAKVAESHRAQSGEVSLTFEETHSTSAKTGAKLRVPEAFLLNIPVFEEGQVYQLPAKLRYRLKGGNITWHYVLYRTDLAKRMAVEAARKQARAETDLPLFCGSPE